MVGSVPGSGVSDFSRGRPLPWTPVRPWAQEKLLWAQSWGWAEAPFLALAPLEKVPPGEF